MARPQNLKQLPGEVEIFQNNLSEQLRALLEKESEKVNQYLKVRFWCQDESRFGCHTKSVEYRLHIRRGKRQWAGGKRGNK